VRPDAGGDHSARAVVDFLERAARRLRLERALRSVVWGPLALFVVPGWIRHARHDAAIAIERRDGRFRNVLITADEILTGRLRVPEYVAARVTADAAAVSAEVDLRAALPLRRVAAVSAGSLLTWLVVIAALFRLPGSGSSGDPARGRLAEGAPQGVWHVDATIVPPAYSGRDPVVLRDPERVEALEGSALHLRIDAGAPRLRLRTPVSTQAFSQTNGRVQTAVVTLGESGFLTLEPSDVAASGQTARARLIAVSVIPDRAPTALVTTPGKDLLVPNASRQIAIAGAAIDDIGLTRLELRYTTIRGSGEQFDFREGSVSIAIDRESSARWRATGDLPLPSLGLEPGDAVIYRLVALDARGATGASDTYMVDIAAPGQPTLAGFELPPDRDRYAISQQMILLKIQRLHARRATLAPDALAEEAHGIAAEQRTVRATFTFLMGGEVQDEEEEAAHAHEIEEGRLENTARRDMLEAVRHMTVVETRLVTADTGGAIPPARAAVSALERAFGRRKYFLRTIPVRSRIDPSRRLSGKLEEARDSSRPVKAGQEPAQAAAARRASADLVALVAQVSGSSSMSPGDAARRFSQAAERVLALDPSSSDLQGASLRLARRAFAVSSGVAVASSTDDLRVALEAVLARARLFAPRPLQPDPAEDALKGRWLSEIEEAGRR
jgi:hypothetical protein